GFAGKKILFVIYATLLGLGEVLKIKIGDLEHFACAFCIASGNNRRVYIIKIPLVKILVYRKSQFGTQAHDRTKSVGANTQMRLLSKFFKAMPFGSQNRFLDFIGIG